MSQVEILSVPAESLIPREDPFFVDTGLPGFLEKVAFGSNLILKGPKGAGKNLNIEETARRLGCPLLAYSCSEETGARDLVGSMVGERVYQLGIFPAAVEIANEEGGCILLLDEVNTLPSATQKLLNSMCDYRQEVLVPRIGRVFRVREASRIWIVGTMNPNYSGTYDLNEDMRSRFKFIDVNYMPPDQEKSLLYSQFPDPGPSAAQRKHLDLLVNLARETRSGQLGYALSTRDLVQFAEDYLRFNNPLDLKHGLGMALKLLEGKYDGAEVSNFQSRVKSIFDVNLSDVKLY